MNEPPEATDEVIDQVVEYIGMKMRKSHIKNKLREELKDPKLGIAVIERLITLAKKRIIETYKVDPAEFKGSSIEFYSMVIRNESEPTKYKLIAQQRLDVLLGLEHTVMEDPQVYAEKIQEALKAMDGTIADKQVE